MADAGVETRALGEFLSQRQKFLLMNSLMLTMFISALDQSIMATALPHILADLGGFKLLSWITTIYLLSSTVTVPIVGKLSDMFGRKPFILAGIAIFVAASAAAGAAPTMPFLIFVRGVQGIGGGIIFACVFSTLGDLFTPIQRARYMGYFIGSFTLASLAGPTLGGFLTDGPGWRWCFYINLPVGTLAATFIWRNLPFTKKGGRLGSIDFLGSILLSSATICVLLGLVWAEAEYGWTSAITIGLFVAGAVLLVLFVFQEARHPQAIFPLLIFRDRVFVQSNLIVAIQGAGMFGAIQYLPTFIQTALGASATASGLVSTPQSVGVFITSIVGGQFVSRTGRFKYQVIFGSSVALVAAFFLTRLDANTVKWHIAAIMVVFGLGSGLVGPTISVITQSCFGQELMGVATSSRQFFMQMGQVIGVAVLGLVFTTTYSSAFGSEIPAATRAQIPANAYAQFEDPTLSLDPPTFARVSQEVRALPNGDALMADATVAQKNAVASAIDRLFITSTAAGFVVLFLSVTLREIPLRRTFSSVGAGEEAPIFEPVLE